MTVVTDLVLADVDLNGAELAGDNYHLRLAQLVREGEYKWLARSPLAYIILDRESAEFFLRSRDTAFPGREIAELFGVNAGRLWAAVADDHGCDFVSAIAKPYPSLTIATVLGAPLADASALHDWSSLVQRQFDIRALDSQVPEMELAVTEVYAYVEQLLNARRSDPGDDLLTTLLTAEEAGDRLSHAECVNLVLNVIAGGIDTTQAQLSHALRMFAAHPDQWEALRKQPELAGAAVQEVLRAEPITPFTARICLRPVEHRGVLFPEGTIVAVCAERGNREQDGEDFDITAPRDDRLLTFGAGPHFCLGANLARAELQEALAFLAPRMPGLAADGPAALGGVEGIYGIDSLPLRWT
jgi:cytochrome P450